MGKNVEQYVFQATVKSENRSATWDVMWKSSGDYVGIQVRGVMYSFIHCVEMLTQTFRSLSLRFN